MKKFITKQTDPLHKHSMGLFSATCLVVGNIIGTGIFILPSVMAPFGAISLLGWLISGLGTLLIALIFLRLSKQIHENGGIYAYSRVTLGDFIGFQVAFHYWVSTWTGKSAFLLSIPVYLSVLYPINTQFSLYISLTLLWGLIGFHALGIKNVILFQRISTVIKLIPLILVPAVGLFSVSLKNFSFTPLSSKGSFSKTLAEAALITTWAFVGMESATIPSEFIKNPKKTIPQATIGGLFLTLFTYTIGTCVLLGVVGPDELKNMKTPYANMMSYIFDSTSTKWLEYFIALAAVVSGLGCLSGWLFLQSQLPYIAAKDGIFPKFFLWKVRKGTPLFGLILSNLLVTGILLMSQSKSLVAQYTFLAKLCAACMLISYIGPIMASITLITRKNKLSSLLLLCGAMSYILWALCGIDQNVIIYESIFFCVTAFFFYRKKILNFVKKLSWA